MPERIQRRRTAGWHMPEGCVYVGRPTHWGNPWREGSRSWTVLPGGIIDRTGKVLTRQDAVDSYRNSLLASPEQVDAARRELAGKDLACWCPLPAVGEPDICHAAVLLAIASPEAGTCRHCGGVLVRCDPPHDFPVCKGWKHAAWLSMGPIGPHYCEGRSVNPSGEPREEESNG